jgi:hypothetical protein
MGAQCSANDLFVYGLCPIQGREQEKRGSSLITLSVVSRRLLQAAPRFTANFIKPMTQAISHTIRASVLYQTNFCSAICWWCCRFWRPYTRNSGSLRHNPARPKTVSGLCAAAFPAYAFIGPVDIVKPKSNRFGIAKTIDGEHYIVPVWPLSLEWIVSTQRSLDGGRDTRAAPFFVLPHDGRMLANPRFGFCRYRVSGRT